MKEEINIWILCLTIFTVISDDFSPKHCKFWILLALECPKRVNAELTSLHVSQFVDYKDDEEMGKSPNIPWVVNSGRFDFSVLLHVTAVPLVASAPDGDCAGLVPLLSC